MRPLNISTVSVSTSENRKIKDQEEEEACNVAACQKSGTDGDKKSPSVDLTDPRSYGKERDSTV